MNWLAPVCVVAGACLTFASLVADYFATGYEAQFGLGQTLVLSAGILSMAIGSGFKWAITEDRRALLRFWAIAGQVALLGIMLFLYNIESRAFYTFVMCLVFCGFIVNHWLSFAYRAPFFLVLSLAAIWGVVGAANWQAGLFLLGCGSAMFAICHLPLGIRLRIAILSLFGLALGFVQTGWIDADSIAVAVPLLASMFMLRLVVYLYDLESGKAPQTFSQRLSYFFMLPNVVFPFYPMVDAATFARTYFNEEATRIYQRGAIWMYRGSVQLLLYRIINRFLIIEAEQVSNPLEFVWYVLMNFSLYLKISGLFHLIVGMLLLFGFNLPETHSRYVLSTSFVDFWRRINIYWKDFMQKIFFTPSYLWLVRRGLSEEKSLIGSIAVVFIVTWALHAYQWFWLRGTLLFTGPDIAFWAILACLLIIQTIHENRHRDDRGDYLMSAASFRIVRIASTLISICVLWSLWTSPSFAAWGDLWLASGLMPAFAPTGGSIWAWPISIGVVALLAAMLSIASGATFGLAPFRSALQDQRERVRKPQTENAHRYPVFMTVVLVGLVALQLPVVSRHLSPDIQRFAYEINETRLSEKDQARLQRGYYEDLTNTNSMNSQLWHLLLGRPNVWDVRDMPAVRNRADYLDYEFIPNSVARWHGVTYAINRWGMFDQDYQRERPAGVVRFALLGSSRETGWGVGYDERYETLLEHRLNEDNPNNKYEILNFAVDGYVGYHQKLVLDEKVWRFSPNAILYAASERDAQLEELVRVFKRIGLPQYLSGVVERAGIKRDMRTEDVIARLHPHRREIVEMVYAHIASEARARGIKPVWFFLSHFGANDPSEIWMAESARSAGFEVITIDSIFQGENARVLRISESDLHPNRRGHRRIADAVFDALKGRLFDK